MPRGRPHKTPLVVALSAWRRQRELTQQVVADMLGVKRQTLTDYEQGYMLPSAGLVFEWAGVLRTDPAPLLWLWCQAAIGVTLADVMAATPCPSGEPPPDQAIAEQLAITRSALDKIEELSRATG